MPKQTDNFRLGYFVAGEFTDPETEQRRWNTVDNLLHGLYLMVGDGVVDGWGLSASTGLTVNIAPGRGVISQVSVESAAAFSLGSLVPNSTNYIYASLTQTSYWDASVAFQVMLTSIAEDAVLLGSVTTNSGGVTAIGTASRHNIGMLSSILDAVKNHRHNGAVGNPGPVDLSSEVQGTLSQRNLPDIDASLITSGTLDSAVMPKIDHTTGLTHIGSLTHSQLDSFVETLHNPARSLMGESALVNLLQLVLSLKAADPFIDEDMVNEFSLVPGYSPDSFVDYDNTTAVVDNDNHKITAGASGSTETFSRTLSTSDVFEQAALVRTTATGDLIRLSPTEIRVEIEDFEDVSDWTTTLTDLSSGQSSSIGTDTTNKTQGASSGVLQVNSSVQGNIALVMEKTFAPQDWSLYNQITFQINTADLSHGDIMFYLRDGIAGEQNSYTVVLESGAPSINRDTLQVGWREITVDVSAYTRDAVIAVGFLTSTQSGWDPSKKFQLNVDDMYLSSGNRFEDDGTAIFTLGREGFPVTWSAVRWDASVPSDSSLTFSWREADTLAGMPSTWTSLGSSPASITSATKALIQIQATFTVSSDKMFSVELHRLSVDWSAVAAEDSFVYDTQEQWLSGSLNNIDASSSPGSIKLSETDNVDGITYGVSGALIKADDSLTPLLTVTGATLPRSTNQVLNGSPAGLGQVSSMDWGPDGSYFVADTDNDRILQISKDGQLLFGLYGSFLTDPLDPYGQEDNGPVAGVDVETPYVPARPEVLHAFCNPNSSQLNVIFNTELESVTDSATTLNPKKFFMATGAHRIHFSADTTFKLWGIDEDKLNAWKDAGNLFMPQFMKRSHVLQIGLSQRDTAVLNSLTDFSVPSLTCPSPKENTVYQNGVNSWTIPGSVTVNFVASNITIGGLDGYRIRVVLTPPSGSVNSQYIATDSVTFNSLTAIGRYSIYASIVDANNVELSNDEAKLTTHFIITTTSDPTMRPLLTPNARFSGNAVSIDYATDNFSPGNVLGGPLIMYRIDGGNYTPWRSYPHSIDIEELTVGSHIVDFYLYDASHTTPPSAASSRGASVTFHCGTSSLTDLKLYLEGGAISCWDRSLAAVSSVTAVDVGNIYMANLYAPLEVQYLTEESSPANPSGEPTVLVGKLRSQASTYALSNASAVASVVTTTITGQQSVDKDLIIFGTRYLDGHSVVQFDLAGNAVFSNNAAKFANARSDALESDGGLGGGLGGVQKTGESELMIADALRKRAIITYTNLVDQSTFVAWQYDSDRAVTDFRLVPVADVVVGITAATVSPAELTVRSGTTVIWKNNSTIPMTIYSGRTTTAQFNADPDLTLYGDVFFSPELKPGEEYARRFDDLGDFYWFAYPAITGAAVSGLVRVSANRISASDKYILVENDTAAETIGGRVVRLDAWGNVEWTFGEGLLHTPRDARPLPDGSIVIST